MANQQVIVSVLSDTKDFAKGMNKVSSTASSTFKKMGGALLGMFALSKIVDVVGEVVDQFKQREDDFGNIGTAYGQQFQDSFNKFSFSLADIGVSTTDAARLGSVLANGFKNAHLSGKELQNTIIRVADISGAMGVEQETVAKQWDNAVRGKTAGMAKLLGMNKQQLDGLIEQKMKTEGLSKAQATQAVLEEKTAKYKGEAAKDAKTLGGQLEILKDKWANIGQQVADVVMPYVIQFSEWINAVALPALAQFGDWLVKNANWLIPLGIALGVVAAAIGIAAAAMAIFNAVMAINPIVLVVIAIAALVAGLVYFFTQTEVGKAAWAAFSTAMSATWEAIKGAFQTGMSAVMGFLGKVWGYIKLVWNYSPLGIIVNNWSKIMDWFGKVPGWIKGFFDSAVSWLKQAGTNVLTGLYNGITGMWTTVSTWIGNIDTKIKGIFDGAVGWLKSAGGNIVEGLWRGISNGYGWIKGKISGWVGDVLSFIKRLFGIKSPSTVMASMGSFMVQGLAKGILDDTKLATNAMGKLSDAIGGTLNTDLALNTVRAGGTVHQYFIDGVQLDLTPEEGEQFKELFNKMNRQIKAGV